MPGIYDIIGHMNDLKIKPFNFTPDYADPEIGLRRRAILENLSGTRSRAIDEISRAGLLGSSTAMNMLSGVERQGARSLEDVTGDVFGKRRLEALGLYRDELDFQRQMKLLREQARLQKELSSGGLGGWGKLFSLGGEALFGMLSGGTSLPMTALANAADYTPPMPALR